MMIHKEDKGNKGKNQRLSYILKTIKILKNLKIEKETKKVLSKVWTNLKRRSTQELTVTQHTTSNSIESKDPIRSKNITKEQETSLAKTPNNNSIEIKMTTKAKKILISPENSTRKKSNSWKMMDSLWSGSPRQKRMRKANRVGSQEEEIDKETIDKPYLIK